jgi:hypothetical protein
MSVYCTVQEAWGQNFGRNNHFQPSLSYDKNDDDSYKKEGFADIKPLDSEKKIYTKQSQIIYRPGDEYTHSSKEYNPFRNPNYYKQEYLSKVPDSYDSTEGSKIPYYDLGTNCANPKNRNLNYTYAEEEYQKFPGKKCHSSIMLGSPKEDNLNLCDSDLCDDITMHVMRCKTCQKSIIKILNQEKKDDCSGKEHFSASREKEEEEENEENELDFTEIILFVMCGIFFIFLLDSIISIGKRFK